jgi:hypothetical protein
MSAVPKIKPVIPSVPGTPPGIYHVTKLEKCKLESDGPSGYRYVIEGGYAPITGFYTGSRDHVMTHATALAKEMNNRRGVKGTKHIVIGKPKIA